MSKKNQISKLLMGFQLVMGGLLCLLSSGQAAAETEWRLLGPAVSWHAGKEGAVIETPAHLRAERDCHYSYAHGQIVGHVCTSVIVPERTAWSEFNPAIGLERITRSEGMSIRDFGQIVRDSYGAWGAMAGRGFTWQLLGSEFFSIEAGLAGGLWYRTTAVTSSEIRNGWTSVGSYGGGVVEPSEPYVVRQTTLQRRLVPFLLPLATVTHKPSGVGLNVSVLPRTSINGRLIVPTTTVMVQASFPIPL